MILFVSDEVWPGLVRPRDLKSRALFDGFPGRWVEAHGRQ